MPVTKKWAYFDHAAVSPLPAPTRDALLHWAAQASEEGDTQWQKWSAAAEHLRRQAAKMIRADEAGIALVANTTSGIHAVAEGYRWQVGDNVVGLDNEFPSNWLPWQQLRRRGVEFRSAPVEPSGVVDLARIVERMDAKTRIVSVSWVGFASGYQLDLAELADLAHQRGAFLFVDAIQGWGAFPVDVAATGVDFLVADGHKWMLGPEGAGLLYVRPELVNHLDVMGIGWNSVQHPTQFGSGEMNLKSTASRLEGGSLNLAGFGALSKSVDLLLELGVEHLESGIPAAILENVEAISERLGALDVNVELPSVRGHRSGIVPVSIPGHEPSLLRRKLLEAGVVVSCRNNRLRISTHAYNNATDIDRLVDALGRALLK